MRSRPPARLERREVELTSTIDDITAKLAAAQHRLSATEAALRQAEQQASGGPSRSRDGRVAPGGRIRSAAAA